jgi:hypothetical protein
LVDVDRAACAPRDRADTDVAIKDAPAGAVRIIDLAAGEVLRAIGSISGQMDNMAVNNLTTTNNVNVLNSPIFATLQANLLQALAPYPNARAAVSASPPE